MSFSHDVGKPTIGLTTSTVFLLNSPVLVALFYMGHHDQSFYSTLLTYTK